MSKPFYHTLLAICLLCILGSTTLSASALATPIVTASAPDIASYHMQVQLDPGAKTVTGMAHITYTNPSTDALNEIWLRLYLRAFRNASTMWMREYGRWMNTLPAEYVGDISVSSLTLNDGTNLLSSATLSETLMQVPLPIPLDAGASLALNVSWVSTLPQVFMRTGYGGIDNSFFMVGQWYPKLAVYDRGQWDSEPWHANAEFFNDFGNYDMSITVPNAYTVAGAGEPAGSSSNGNGTHTYRFNANGITDFAFAASPDFQEYTTTAGTVTIALYVLPEHSAAVARYLAVAAEALALYSSWYGDYPYPRLTIVDVPDNATAAGGMEYPTLITSEVGGTYGFLAYVTSHEIGHQWWPMQTASNEAREPWLDEGLTEYTGSRYMAVSSYGWGHDDTIRFEQNLYSPYVTLPATLPAWQYSSGSYVTVYAKTALGLWTLEHVVGTARFQQAMRSYLSQYRFRHPQAADFRAALESSLGDLSWLFDDFLNGTGQIDYSVGPISDTNVSSSVSITRKGAVRVPVEILITLANGEQYTHTWSGPSSQITLAFPATTPILNVRVDPAYKLSAELRRQDNQTGQWKTYISMLIGNAS